MLPWSIKWGLMQQTTTKMYVRAPEPPNFQIERKRAGKGRPGDVSSRAEGLCPSPLTACSVAGDSSIYEVKVFFLISCTPWMTIKVEPIMLINAIHSALTWMLVWVRYLSSQLLGIQKQHMSKYCYIVKISRVSIKVTRQIHWPPPTCSGPTVVIPWAPTLLKSGLALLPLHK